ncbi:uncharacterized protein [Rutidosis leptorrhynchoides]|uniref:uncharacterized protein isoform X2 n=1 Tax=Rutidosis leptorrhynchoides TaxID=125765 RepID=UPI003A99E881
MACGQVLHSLHQYIKRSISTKKSKRDVSYLSCTRPGQSGGFQSLCTKCMPGHRMYVLSNTLCEKKLVIFTKHINTKGSNERSNGILLRNIFHVRKHVLLNCLVRCKVTSINPRAGL